MIEHVIPVYKFEGETPLSCIKRMQQSFPEYKTLPMTYAGRLDPMACGMLLLLTGDECKNKDAYLGLDKTYVIEVLLGVSTDTHDVLGVIEGVSESGVPEISEAQIREIVQSFQGKQYQAYPAYSSKTVHGKPLFSYAREEKLGDIEIPGHEITIHEITLGRVEYVPLDTIREDALQRIDQVQGDFRQDAIKESWRAISHNETDKCALVSLEVRASSGTYMRQLAYDIGKKLGIPALALSIKRTRVGEYTL
jgi:tRNA pseudouridine55 synthase